MKPDIHVDIEALRTHADRVNAVSDAVQPGVDGLRHMSSHPEIYGIILSELLVPIARHYEEQAAAAFAAARDTTRRVADDLRSIADGYEETDRRIARLIAGKERP